MEEAPAEAPTRAARFADRLETAAAMTAAVERLLLAEQQATTAHATLDQLERVLAAAEARHADNEARRVALAAAHPVPPTEDAAVAELWGAYGAAFTAQLARQAADVAAATARCAAGGDA